MSGMEAAWDDVQACKNIIEVWLRVFDLRGSPPPITWAHLQDLAEAFATLLASERAAQAAQTRALREALEERAATACKKTCGWSRTMVGGAIQHTPDHTPECDRARALTGAPREEPA